MAHRAKDGVVVSCACQRAVLKVVDDHHGPGRPAWVSYKTIAPERPPRRSVERQRQIEAAKARLAAAGI
ncbi:MAG TPA: hypothetical protein VMY42_23760 [Thermoguttaceae bacterium]|nr:hypothetical protein [Thermoguttaceae bacterium]